MLLRTLLEALLVTTFLATTVGSQSGVPQLLRDVHARPAASNPDGFATAGSHCYFVASDPRNYPARALWRTGAQPGTAEQIDPPAGTIPTANRFAPFAVGALVFHFRETGSGFELRCFDTTNDSMRVIPLPPGDDQIRTENLANLNGRFLAQTEQSGLPRYTVWISDGTAAGTWSLNDLLAPSRTVRGLLGTTGSPTPGLRLAWFVAHDPATPDRSEIWLSDGTSGGTRQVATLPAGEYPLSGLGEAAAGHAVFVTLPGGLPTNPALWSLDSGTDQLRSLGAADASLANFRVPVRFDGRAWFTHSGTATGIATVTDGVTTEVVDVAGSQNGLARPLGVVAGALWLWASPDLLLRVDPGSLRPTVVGNTAAVNNRPVVEVGGKLYFESWGGSDVHVLDPRTATTRQLVGRVARAPTAFGDLVVFRHDGGEHGAEPWAYDPGLDQVFLLQDLFVGDPRAHSRPQSFVRVGERTLFVAAGRGLGGDVWSTDGSRDGTAQHFVVGTSGMPVGAELLQAGDQDAWLLDLLGSPPAMRLSDGRTNGMRTVYPLRFGPGVSAGLAPWTPLGESLLLAGSIDGVEGLHRFDRDGTHELLVGQRFAGADFLVHGELAWFLGGSANSRRSLWVTDGTVAGTLQLLPGTTVLDQIEVFADRLWVVGNADVRTWDGAAFATFPALARGRLVVAGQRMFSLSNPPRVTDGTAAGTVEVPLPNGVRSDDPSAALGERLLFFDRDHSPWITDGTARGTWPLAPHLYRTRDSAGIVVLSPERAVFGAGEADGRGGFRQALFLTDGTPTGTRRLLTLDATNLALVNGLVYFAGADPDFGIEPYVFDPGPVVEPVGHPCTSVPMRSVELGVDSEPRIGSTLTVHGRATGARTAYPLLGRPFERALKVEGLHCFVHVDLHRLLDFGPLTTDPTGAFRLDLAIPDDPALLGEVLMLQTFFAPGAGNLLDVSQGLRLKLGR